MSQAVWVYELALKVDRKIKALTCDGPRAPPIYGQKDDYCYIVSLNIV